LTERAAPPAAKRVRIVATLEPGATHDEFLAAVAAVGGAVIACDARTVTAEVPGGAMGRLALVDCVAAIRAGESWDAPGRQAPDGPPEVRKRLEQRERDAGAGRSGEPQDPLEE
jgi:hypothetical protein